MRRNTVRTTGEFEIYNWSVDVPVSVVVGSKVVVVTMGSGQVKLPLTLTKGIEYLKTTYPDTETLVPGSHENPMTSSSRSRAEVCATALPGVL